jgi:ribosome recycling factor
MFRFSIPPYVTSRLGERGSQIAQVHAPEAQLITIQPFDPTSCGRHEQGKRDEVLEIK